MASNKKCSVYNKTLLPPVIVSRRVWPSRSPGSQHICPRSEKRIGRGYFSMSILCTGQDYNPAKRISEKFVPYAESHNIPNGPEGAIYTHVCRIPRWANDIFVFALMTKIKVLRHYTGNGGGHVSGVYKSGYGFPCRARFRLPLCRAYCVLTFL